MTTVSVHIKVADYTNWRKEYDSMDGTRRQFGATSDRVVRAASDPNEITVLTEWPSIEQAKAYTASPDLKAAMQRGGVVSQPDVAFLESL